MKSSTTSPISTKIFKIITTNKNSLAYKLNNPGNLKYAGQEGATRGKRGFASFRTSIHGYNALIRQVKKDQSRQLTLKQFINKYAPPLDHNHWNAKYIDFISSQTGLHHGDHIDLVSAESIAKSVMWIESQSYIE